MCTFLKKLYTRENALRTTPFALLVFLATSLWPTSVEGSPGLYVYEYGLFGWLELLHEGSTLLDYRNIFSVISAADDFAVPLVNLAASIAVCHFVVLLIYVRLKKK